MATSLSVGAAERTVSVLKWRRKRRRRRRRRRRVLDLFQGPIPFHKAVLHLLVWPYHPTMPSQSSHNLLSPNVSSTASKQCNKQVQERTKLLKFIHSAFMNLIGIHLVSQTKILGTDHLGNSNPFYSGYSDGLRV
jgi:hypothetical protein